MIKRTLLFFSLLLTASFGHAGTIHIVYPEGSSIYLKLAQQLENKITSWQESNQNLRDTISVKNSRLFSIDEVQKDDLLINLNNIDLSNDEKSGKNSEKNTEKNPEKNIDTLYSFANKGEKTSQNSAYVYINQPIENMLAVAERTIKKQFNNTILIIVSEKNTSTLAQLKKIKDRKQVKVITIKEGDIAAKVIEKEFYTAGAIVALYDPLIWSGNSARWLLQQAYNYKVPIIGYSKAFLKAGAMVSVYSSADNIILTSYERTIDWINRGKFSKRYNYPEYTIEINRNIARALGFSESDIIAIGEKQ